MKPILTIKNLSYKYSQAEQSTFNDLNFSLERGQLYALIGANGTGKSTLLKILARVYKQQEGSIMYNDQEINKLSSTLLNNEIIYCTQYAHDGLFSTLTVYEHVCIVHMQKYGLLASLPSKESVRQQLAPYHAQLPARIDNQVSSLSGGEKQMFVLALSFIKPAKLLLLDEPTSALDVHTAHKAMSIIKQKALENGCTVVMISHNIHEIKTFAQRLLLLKKDTLIGDYICDEVTAQQIHDLVQ